MKLAQVFHDANVLFSKHDYRAAETLLASAIETVPTDVRLHGQLAMCAFSRKAFSVACDAAAIAVEHEGWTPRYWHLLAASLAALDREADARLVYQRILALWPADQRASAAFSGLRAKKPSRDMIALTERVRVKPKLSACLIAKNEASRLQRCLDSLKDVVDEIVVVDTGSSDDTVAIAERSGARVSHFPWVDDFSAARNASLEQASGEWILLIDADNILSDVGDLRSCLTDPNRGAFTVRIDNVLDGGLHSNERVVRLFRRHPLVRFEGRIHEQVSPSLLTAGFLGGDSNIVFGHDGYLREAMESTQKLARNERLLQLEIAQDPDDAYWHYQLGKNYMMARDYRAALAAFHQSREKLPQTPGPFARDLFCSASSLLITSRDFAAAQDWIAGGRRLFPTCPDLASYSGQVCLELGNRVGATRAFAEAVASKVEPLLPALLQLAQEGLNQIAIEAPAPLYAKSYMEMRACKHGTFLYNRHDAFIGKALALYGEWCEAELDLLLPLLVPGMCVVDVGANIGTHTVAFASAVGRNGQVIAFEPQALVFQNLCANLALNALTQVTPVQAAVGAEPGTIAIPHLDPEHATNFGAVKAGHGEHIVERVTLDALQLERCDLIKIDVEGMEAEVIAGARETIARCKSVLFVENNTLEWSKAIIETIKSLNYKAYWHIAAYYNPRNFAGHETNVFARYQPEANLLAVPMDVPVNGMLLVDGPSDDWHQAVGRLTKR